MAHDPDIVELAADFRETLVRFWRAHIMQRSADLSLTQVMVLGAADRDDMNVTKLAALLNVRLSTMSVLVNRLEEQDLVWRDADPRDLRVLQIRATPKGVALLEEVRKRSNEYVAGLMDTLDRDDLMTIRDATKVFQKLLSEQPLGE